MNEVSTMISNLGFPIFICLGFGIYIMQDRKAEREENAKREERYLNTIDKFGDSLDKVNTTMLSMDKRLELIEKEKGE